jgi:hypothetical protein
MPSPSSTSSRCSAGWRKLTRSSFERERGAHYNGEASAAAVPTRLGTLGRPPCSLRPGGGTPPVGPVASRLVARADCGGHFGASGRRPPAPSLRPLRRLSAASSPARSRLQSSRASPATGRCFSGWSRLSVAASATIG